MISFGRVQDASMTPFDATSSEAINAGITSSDVFNAIIEAKLDALANDGYPIFCYRNAANAGSNSRLQIWPGIDSSVAPLVLPESCRIVAYSFGAIAAATGTIIIRNLTTSQNIATINFSATKSVTAINLSLPVQAASSRIEVYVGSGTFNRPHGIFWLQKTAV